MFEVNLAQQILYVLDSNKDFVFSYLAFLVIFHNTLI